MKKLIILFLIIAPFFSKGQPQRPSQNAHYMAVSFDEWLTIYDSVYTLWHAGYKPLLLAPPSFDYQYEYIVTRKRIPNKRFDNMTGTYLPASGAWVTGATTTPGWYNKTIGYSAVTNATVEFSFQGSRIRVYGEKHTTHGIVAISVDGGPEQLVNLYSPTKKTAVEIFSFYTDYKVLHKIKIRVTGTKDPLSTNYYGTIDMIEVTP